MSKKRVVFTNGGGRLTLVLLAQAGEHPAKCRAVPQEGLYGSECLGCEVEKYFLSSKIS